jgi:hypothetical protein
MRLVFTWNVVGGGTLTVNAKHVKGMHHIPSDGVWPERTIIAADGFPAPIQAEENAETFRTNAQMWREVLMNA